MTLALRASESFQLSLHMRTLCVNCVSLHLPLGTVLLLLPDPGAKDAKGVWKEGKKTAHPDLEAAGGCQAEELGGPEGQAVYKVNGC